MDTVRQTYTLQLRDDDTGIVLEWRNVPSVLADYLVREPQPPSVVCVVLGSVYRIFWEAENWPELPE